MEASDEHQHSGAQLAGLARGERNGAGQWLEKGLSLGLKVAVEALAVSVYCYGPKILLGIHMAVEAGDESWAIGVQAHS